MKITIAKLAILLSSLAALITATPITNLNNSTTLSNLSGRSACFLNIDHSKRPWPTPATPQAYLATFPEHEWLDWHCAFENHLDVMPREPRQTYAESLMIKTAIDIASQQTGVDPRLILSIIMQESHGEVRVRSTQAPDGSSTSGGLMQCGNCHSVADISLGQPVPQERVNKMVIDGARWFGDNINNVPERNPFSALREYNSGRFNPADLNDPIFATRDYVWEAANRLRGWRN
jgi:hypothetical protein